MKWYFLFKEIAFMKNSELFYLEISVRPFGLITVREFVGMCHLVNIFKGPCFSKYFKFKKNKVIITVQEDSGNPVTKERSWLMTN